MCTYVHTPTHNSCTRTHNSLHTRTHKRRGPGPQPGAGADPQGAVAAQSPGITANPGPRCGGRPTAAPGPCTGSLGPLAFVVRVALKKQGQSFLSGHGASPGPTPRGVGGPRSSVVELCRPRAVGLRPRQTTADPEPCTAHACESVCGKSHPRGRPVPHGQPRPALVHQPRGLLRASGPGSGPEDTGPHGLIWDLLVLGLASAATVCQRCTVLLSGTNGRLPSLGGLGSVGAPASEGAAVRPRDCGAEVQGGRRPDSRGPGAAPRPWEPPRRCPGLEGTHQGWLSPRTRDEVSLPAPRQPWAQAQLHHGPTGGRGRPWSGGQRESAAPDSEWGRSLGLWWGGAAPRPLGGDPGPEAALG